MNTDLFALLLASGRAFTMLPDGSIQVPAANVNVKTPVKTFDNDVKDAKDSDKTFDNSASDVKEKPLTNSLPQQPVRPAAPDTASNEATVKSEDVKDDVLTKPLTNDLQEVLTRFAGQGSVQISDVANAFDISRQLAQYRLRRLVELTDGLVTKGEHRGEYNFRTIPESAVGAGAEPHVDSDDAPKGAMTLASNREEKREPSNYSKSNTYGKSLGSNANVIASNRGEQSSDADQSQEHRSDCSNRHPRCNAPTPSPAPAATSHKPPATDSIDLDDLDEDERDALEAEECAASGRAQIRLNLLKHTRQNPWVMPPPVPKREPHAHADVPVVVEDDDEDEGWDPDEHVSGCL